jgi:hypothetical protein
MTALAADSPQRVHWEDKRLGRLGFLMGIGWNGQRIADDLGTTRNNVYAQANRLGLSFREARAMSLDLSPSAHLRFGEAADKRGLTRDALGRLLLHEIACDPHLIDNVLDDAADEAAA